MSTASVNRKIILNTLFLTVILGAVGAALFLTVLSHFFLWIYLPLLLFNAILTSFICIILIRSLQKRTGSFFNRYLLSVMIKFFASILFYTLYVFLNKSNAIQFTIVFFGLYIAYTTFELQQILKYSKIIR